MYHLYMLTCQTIRRSFKIMIILIFGRNERLQASHLMQNASLELITRQVQIGRYLICRLRYQFQQVLLGDQYILSISYQNVSCKKTRFLSIYIINDSTKRYDMYRRQRFHTLLSCSKEGRFSVIGSFSLIIHIRELEMVIKS